MNELIDSRNEKLWNEINENYIVTFEDSTNGEYACDIQSENVIFIIDKNNLCKDSFTHEMLHVYMSMKDLYFSSALKLTIPQSRLLSENLTFDLIEHIGNCLDHIKILPIYLELGFDRTKFLLDYDLYKCSAEEISQFNKYYKVGKKINTKAIDSYIGRLVAIFSDPNESFDYSSDLNKLQKIDPLLYKIVERLINHTKELKVVDRKNHEDNHRTVISNFYKNLTKWIAQNKFT